MQTFELPFGAVRAKLRELLTATANKLNFEWPYNRSRYSYSREMLLSLVSAATNVYEAIKYLCADTPKDPFRKKEFALAVPPMSRVILEALYTLVFTLDDLESRTEWFHKAGWRELREEIDRARHHHGNDPRWQGYISKLEGSLEVYKDEFGITADEQQDPKKIKRWPIPSRMKDHKYSLSSDRKRFLEYLEDWFYRALSQDAHLSFRGLVRHYLVLQMNHQDDGGKMSKHKSAIFIMTIVLLLSIMSEIEIEFSFGLSERLAYLWVMINSTSSLGQEIYEMRYAGKLCAA